MKKSILVSLLFLVAAQIFAIPNLLDKKDYRSTSIKELDFDLAWETLELKETYENTIDVEIYCNNKKFTPIVKTSDSKLLIESVSKQKNYFPFNSGLNCTVIVYIPQEKQFDKIEIESSSGSIKSEIALNANVVNIKTSSGSSTLENGAIAQKIKISASSGSIFAKKVQADTFSAEASSGNIEIQDYKGSTASLKSFSGGIKTQDFAAEYVEFEVTSGRISSTALDCEYFDAQSTSGSIYLELSRAPAAKSQIKSSSGSISLVVPKSANFDIEAHSSSGSFKNDFSNTKFVPRSVYQEKINEGGATIELSTTSGNLSLEY
ncbi:MAG: DUF4097 family beta strand repeat protein [Treponema sp.]|nr:DUF4097 family beta strand repeat protein [Treponema sp.]